jgi:hypothetical protein
MSNTQVHIRVSAHVLVHIVPVVRPLLFIKPTASYDLICKRLGPDLRLP